MTGLSSAVVLVLLVVFLLFLSRAYLEDQKHQQRLSQQTQACPTCKQPNDPTGVGFHAAVVDTIKYEHANGMFAHTRVRKMLTSSRDQIVRGLIMGAVEGSATTAMRSAVTWSLVGGIVSGINDMLLTQTVL